VASAAAPKLVTATGIGGRSAPLTLTDVAAGCAWPTVVGALIA
jgi:hypothetical protein